MKMNDALKTIESAEKRGFMVHFERIEGSMLVSDYFPDKHSGEPLIETELDAWALASRFAKANYGKYVNIYVINSHFIPVGGYKRKEIKNR